MRPDLDRLMSAGLSGSAMSVYLAIATRCESGPATISDQELSEMTGRPARTVRRARTELVQAELIVQVAQPGRPALLSLAGQAGKAGHRRVAKNGQGQATAAKSGHPTPSTTGQGVAKNGRGASSKNGQGKPATPSTSGQGPINRNLESGESGKSGCSSSKTTTTTATQLPTSNSGQTTETRVMGWTRVPLDSPPDPARLAEIYNRHCGEDLPPVTLVRQTGDWINADCLVESWGDAWQTELEDWINSIVKARFTPFCRGEGPNGWRVNFSWLVKDPGNFRRILDGFYERGSSQSRQWQGAQTWPQEVAQA